MGKLTGKPFAYVVVLLLAAWAPLARSAEGQTYQVAQGDVRVTVPLRPGGGFEARTTSLVGRLALAEAKPVQLSGELQVDLATIDTGIDLRNRHLRDNYLEIAKGPAYQKAVLTEIRLAEADGEAFEGRSGFTGTLRLHNVTKPVAGSAEIRREGAGHRVVATFPLLLTDFGIEPPQYMGVGVGNKLAVKVSFLTARGGAR
jgi:polyisoprenoid-binding protein YceI